MTWMLGPGSGQGSGNSQTRRQSRPWYSNHTACHRSRSRGVGARYIRRRTSAPSMRHRTSGAPISSIPNFNPRPFPSLLLQLPRILPANDVGFTLVSV